MKDVHAGIPEEDRIDTVLGADVEFSGEIQTEKSFMVKGRVRGKIESGGDLFIAEGAVSEAELHGPRVTIAGISTGDIFADLVIQALPGSEVEGTLTAPRIDIEPGCRFSGTLITIPDDDAR